MDQTWDYLVVGSGPGGATVARELSRAGKKVLLLEKGKNPPLRDSFWQYLRYQLIPFRSLLFTYRWVAMVRGIISGGSSIFYYGTAFPVPISMLKKYGVDITKEVEQVKKEIPFQLLPEDALTPMAKRIQDTAKSLGYKWERLHKFMDFTSRKPGQPFGYYGDPTDVKWTSRHFIREATQNGAKVLSGVSVEKVLFEGDRAVGVRVKTGWKKQDIYAKTIILSAGGIGTPVILKKSGMDGVGKNFFFDPLITVGGEVEDIKVASEIPMSAGYHFEKEGFMMTDMSVPRMVDAIFSLMVLRPDKIFAQRKTLRIMIKIRDDLGGYISKFGQIKKRLTANDRKKFDEGYRIARKILEKAGARRIYKTWYIGAHPGGTVKIGEFLDANLKLKNRENLYVCDCSVIPEPWGLPPTMTIVALGKYLTKKLIAKNA